MLYGRPLMDDLVDYMLVISMDEPTDWMLVSCMMSL